MLARTPPKCTEETEKRSPPKTQTLPSQKSPPKTQTISSVRRSVEKLEAVGSEPQNLTPSTSKADTQLLPRQVLTNRAAEGKANLIKIRMNLNQTRIKPEFKATVLEAVDRMLQIIKEAETELKQSKKTGESSNLGTTHTSPNKMAQKETVEGDRQILDHLKEQSRLLIENGKKLDELKSNLDQHHHQITNSRSYAEATTARSSLPHESKSALHSVVISSQDEKDTGDQVLTKVREAVNAKEGWIRVERTRKGKDRKIIMSCNTEEDRKKVKERIEQAGKNLVVEEVKNRDPLLRLADVLTVNTDEEILKAFRKQNKDIFHGLKDTEDRLEFKYRKRARNPHASHVVLSVSPAIWKKTIEAGAVYIDLQRIRVFDQSPLVQCSRCLGYGHSKKYCMGTADLCSHCGGPHLRAQCPEWHAGSEPTCRNCTAANCDRSDHNAFSNDCPIRRKRDAIARMSVAYC